MLFMLMVLKTLRGLEKHLGRLLHNEFCHLMLKSLFCSCHHTCLPATIQSNFLVSCLFFFFKGSPSPLSQGTR